MNTEFNILAQIRHSGVHDYNKATGQPATSSRKLTIPSWTSTPCLHHLCRCVSLFSLYAA